MLRRAACQLGKQARGVAASASRLIKSGEGGDSNPKEVHLPRSSTLKEVSKALAVRTDNVEATLKELGVKVPSPEDVVPPDAVELTALEFGYKARLVGHEKESEAAAKKEPRWPVACVLGHVDHGKTTLLDALRKSSIASREEGGITQHVGAFVARIGQGTIVFLDTPGHAAFDMMRARGASITDMAILVVAGDDSVQEQTREALNHLRRQKTPFVVAITKCDKRGADPKRARSDLLSEGVELEDAGGEVQAVDVSAVSGKGLDHLEEALLLQADTLDLSARVDGRAKGDVVDARIERGVGPVATVVVKNGVLSTGDSIVAGHEHGRVKSLRGEGKKSVKRASPGEPVDVMGMKGTPPAGVELEAVGSESRAKRISEARESRRQEERQNSLRQSAANRGIPGTGGEPLQAGSSRQKLPVIVKADTEGSAEAAKRAIEVLGSDVVQLEVVHTGVGEVAPSDVELARTSNGIVVGLGVKANSDVKKRGAHAGAPVHCSSIIYTLLDRVSEEAAKLAPTQTIEEEEGSAEVLQVFEIKLARRQRLKVAGCRVHSGSVARSGKFRVVRNTGQSAHDNLLECSSLKRHKLDVNSVGRGNECGIALHGFEDFREGDRISCVRLRSERLPVQSSHLGGFRLVQEGE